MPISDGTPVTGSFEVTIDSVATILENINVSFGSTVVSDMDEDGVPARNAIFATNPTCSGTFQVASSSTAEIEVGDTFALASSGPFTGTWILTEVKYDRGQTTIMKGTFSAINKINV
jgi:hypothetical protein